MQRRRSVATYTRHEVCHSGSCSGRADEDGRRRHGRGSRPHTSRGALREIWSIRRGSASGCTFILPGTITISEYSFCEVLSHVHLLQDNRAAERSDTRVHAGAAASRGCTSWRLCRKVDSNSLLSTKYCGFVYYIFQCIVWSGKFATEPEIVIRLKQALWLTVNGLLCKERQGRKMVVSGTFLTRRKDYECPTDRSSSPSLR
jgi:hypothetical protein